MVAPPELISYIDKNKASFIQRLREAVAIPSVSGEAAHRQDVLHMAEWLESQLKQYGVETKSQSLGRQTLEGKDLDLPPAILGRIGDDKTKKTVLIYGHFDVQPAYQSDGWESDPFVLVEKSDGRLVGRGKLFFHLHLRACSCIALPRVGSSDDKGPILGWLNVLEAAHNQKLELPVNLRFVFEGMEESGSEGLDDFINGEAQNLTGWFQDVDCVCIVRLNCAITLLR
jgi:Cys-Gly metallodipeptidase DUG1